MIAIIGASASGKTEIAKLLSKDFGINKCITTTTRDMRINEINGIHYHFIGREQFKSILAKDGFVEHTNYQGNYYGINRNDVNSSALVIVDPNGANELIRQLEDTLYVVYIESPREKRQTRMLARGDDIVSIQKRLESDDKIFNKNNLDKIDLYIINNDEPLYQIAKFIEQSYKSYLLIKDM